MSNEIQKLKQTILILNKENSDFKRYNGHLRAAIVEIYESNEKLLFSLHEKYKYFGELESQNKNIENDVQNKMRDACNFDFNIRKHNHLSRNDLSNSISLQTNNKSNKDTNTLSSQMNSDISNKTDNPIISSNMVKSSQKKLIGHNDLDNQIDSTSQMISEVKASAISNLSFSGDSNLHKNHKNSTYIINKKINDQNKSKLEFFENPENLAKPANKVDSSDYDYLSDSINNSNLANRKDSNNHASLQLYNTHDATESHMRYSQDAVRSLAIKSFTADSDISSIEKLKEKQNILIETNQNLKMEIKRLFSKVGEAGLFLEVQKESESYLKALNELHELQELHNTLGIYFNDRPSSDGHPVKSDDQLNSNSADDDHNLTSNVFLTDVDTRVKSKVNSNSDQENSEAKDNQPIVTKNVDQSCQTHVSIKSKFFMRYFSKEVRQRYLENQATKIAFRKSSIANLTSEIEKCKIVLNEIITRRSQATPLSSQIQNIINIDICDHYDYVDIETETDPILDFESILAQIEQNSKFTKDYLIVSNDRFNLQTIYEQKTLELKIAQIATDRKTTNYRSLLRTLKTTDPDCYAKFIGTVGMSSKAEQKRQRYLQQINKFTEKIKRANDETKEIEIKEKQVKLRIEMLERELMVFKNPKDHLKSILADLCQTIALNQEKIRDQMRELSFVKLETDFVDRIKIRILKETAQTDDMAQKINGMYKKLKKIKGRCRYSLRNGQKYPITSPSELDNLQELFNALETEVNSFENKIKLFAKKSISCFHQLTEYDLNVPSPPKSCETVHINLKNVV
ncbi:hypothetical protein M9Y10_038973 [Tritrichomonas musculus]|uniref:Uncharacterized protein n=1 Tax=Tritrichomonas musculus TaxID=1915356 RepID=A0ABR2KA03_9EUKA